MFIAHACYSISVPSVSRGVETNVAYTRAIYTPSNVFINVQLWICDFSALTYYLHVAIHHLVSYSQQSFDCHPNPHTRSNSPMTVILSDRHPSKSWTMFNLVDIVCQSKWLSSFHPYTVKINHKTVTWIYMSDNFDRVWRALCVRVWKLKTKKYANNPISALLVVTMHRFLSASTVRQ